MEDLTKSSGGRIALGIGAGLALSLAVGPWFVWIPIGIVGGILWGKKA